MNGPAIWAPASANPDLTTLRRLIARTLALDIFSSPTPTASLWRSSRFSRCRIPRRPCGRSGRPGHLAATVLDRTRNRSAANDLSHMEEIVGGRTARLGVANKEGCEQLILPRAIEGRVRPERNFRRQMEILQGFRHVDCLQRVRLGRRERAGPDRHIAEPGAGGRHVAGALLGRLDELGDMRYA